MTGLQPPLTIRKLSPLTFAKPNFVMPPSITSSTSTGGPLGASLPSYYEVKLTTRATSPIILDPSRQRLIATPLSYSSLSSISATSFSVSLKNCTDSQRLMSPSLVHTSMQTDETNNNDSSATAYSTSTTLNLSASTTTRQIKSISFIQPKTLIKLDEQQQSTGGSNFSMINGKTPSPPPPHSSSSSILATTPNTSTTTGFTLKPVQAAVQKHDHDTVVKTKPYQLMSFNLLDTTNATRVPANNPSPTTSISKVKSTIYYFCFRGGRFFFKINQK